MADAPFFTISQYRQFCPEVFIKEADKYSKCGHIVISMNRQEGPFIRFFIENIEAPGVKIANIIPTEVETKEACRLYIGYLEEKIKTLKAAMEQTVTFDLR